jgi:hypothetical protein
MDPSAGQQIIVVQAPRLRRSYDSYASTPILILGCAQIFNGLASLGLGVANPLTCGLYGMIGDGIWCGVLYIIAGVMGIVSSRRRSSCTVNTHLVLSVISAFCAIVEFCLNVVASTHDNHDDYAPVRLCYYYFVGSTTFMNNINVRGTIAVDALLCCFAGLELIVATIAAMLSCRVSCGSSEYKQFDTTSVHGLPANSLVYTSQAPSGGKSGMHIGRG